jgi:hypothetical protein
MPPPLRVRFLHRLNRSDLIRIEKRKHPLLGRMYSLSKTVLRKEDFVALRFDFYNLKKLNAGGETKLFPVDAGKESYIVVHFPPQHIIEEAYYQQIPSLQRVLEEAYYQQIPRLDTDPLDLPPIPALIGGPTRLAFTIPKSTLATGIPYTIDSLLRLNEWTDVNLRVVPYAKDIPEWSPPQLREPKQYETMIELPYHIILSPSESQHWKNSGPVADGEKHELWHMRTTDGTKMRAVWSPDIENDWGETEDSFRPLARTAMGPTDCRAIVHNSSDFSRPSQPQKIKVKELMLSSLGGWLEAEGNWPSGTDVEQWYHKATQGRDHHVRVVKKGFYFPTGHRAALIVITQRTMQEAPIDSTTQQTQVGAYLRMQMHLITKDPEIKYSNLSGHPNPSIYNWIFNKIRILNVVTPVIDAPVRFNDDVSDSDIFWPMIGGNPINFNMIALDLKDRECHFNTPLLFINESLALDCNKLKKILELFFGIKKNHDMLNVNLGQQKLSFEGSDSDDTLFETNHLIWGWQPSLVVKEPCFFPRIEEASVKISALEKLLGKSDSVKVKFTPFYTENGFDEKNKGEVFLELLDKTANSVLDFNELGADTSGGIAAPNLDISAISRSRGPVGGNPDKITDGIFNPSDYFSDAEIFGGISLADILNSEIVRITDTPRFQTRSISNGIESTFNWKAEGQSLKAKDSFKPNGSTSLVIDVKLITKEGEKVDEPEYTVTGVMKDFLIDFGVIALKFNSFEFSSLKGQKPTVNVDVADVSFAGPLSFVDEIRKSIPTSGFSNGPHFDISPSGITAGYSIGIPTIGVGIFSLQNVTLSAALNLPFTDKPLSTKFEFAKREDPFLVSVAMFGGGGYFGIEVTSDGIESVEAALEFGGNISIDIGVASGGVYIMAGIYFKLEGDKVQLSGYLRCGGSLEILGLISLSLEFYMALTYESGDNGVRVWGQATLTVEVDIAFFSKSVELTVEREFANSPHFSFADTVSYDDWNNYCTAFAEEVAA